LMVFWRKQVLRNVDILIAKSGVQVDTRAGDADQLLRAGAYRFKAMLVRGDALGTYRVAVDFKEVRDARIICDADPFLLVFDLRHEDTSRDPPPVNLQWLAQQRVRPDGCKWYVGALELAAGGGAHWIERYNVMADAMYQSLAPPSPQQQQQQLSPRGTPIDRHSPQRKMTAPAASSPKRSPKPSANSPSVSPRLSPKRKPDADSSSDERPPKVSPSSSPNRRLSSSPRPPSAAAAAAAAQASAHAAAAAASAAAASPPSQPAWSKSVFNPSPGYIQQIQAQTQPTMTAVIRSPSSPQPFQQQVPPSPATPPQPQVVVNSPPAPLPTTADDIRK